MADIGPWPGIIGTLSGVALGGGLTALRDRTQWKRQRSDRWDELRRATAVDLVALSERLLDHCEDWRSIAQERVLLKAQIESEPAPVRPRVSSEVAIPTTSEQPSTSGLVDGLDANETRFDETIEKMVIVVANLAMLASPRTQEAGVALMRACRSLQRLAFTGTACEEEWEAASQEVLSRRVQFIEASRQEIGIAA